MPENKHEFHGKMNQTNVIRNGEQYQLPRNNVTIKLFVDSSPVIDGTVLSGSGLLCVKHCKVDGLISTRFTNVLIMFCLCHGPKNI